MRRGGVAVALALAPGVAAHNMFRGKLRGKTQVEMLPGGEEAAESMEALHTDDAASTDDDDDDAKWRRQAE